MQRNRSSNRSSKPFQQTVPANRSSQPFQPTVPANRSSNNRSSNNRSSNNRSGNPTRGPAPVVAAAAAGPGGPDAAVDGGQPRRAHQRAGRVGWALFATLFSPELGLWVGTFHHVIQSRTRVMGWHFSPRYSVQNSSYGLSLFTTLFCSQDTLR
jgi:hypothetical protein